MSCGCLWHTLPKAHSASQNASLSSTTLRRCPRRNTSSATPTGGIKSSLIQRAKLATRGSAEVGCPPPGVLGASDGRGWGVGHARYHVGGAAGCRRAGADGIVGVAPNVELKLVSNGGRIEFQSKLLGLPCRVHQPPLSPSSYRPGRRHEPTTLIMPTAAAPTRAPSWAPSASSGGAARPRWGAWWPQLDQWLPAGAGSPLSAGGGGIAGHPG